MRNTHFYRVHMLINTQIRVLRNDPRQHDFVWPTLAVACKVGVGWTTLDHHWANAHLTHLTWYFPERLLAYAKCHTEKPTQVCFCVIKKRKTNSICLCCAKQYFSHTSILFYDFVYFTKFYGSERPAECFFC